MKVFDDASLKRLISLIKRDINKKQDTITATGILTRDESGAIDGIETETATLVDLPNGLLKSDGTTISAAVPGTDYMVGVSPTPSSDTPKKPSANGAVGTSADYARADHQHPAELPSGGSEGQVLTKTASGVAWANAASGIMLDSIQITTPPTKTAYKAGEAFSPAGMVVKANYSNGTTVIIKDILITGWNVTPSGALAVSDTKVTVQYTENGVTKTADQAVMVTRISVSVPSQNGSLIYTGSSQSPKWNNYDSAKIAIGGTTSSINAGSYSATFTIKNTELYCWTDGSTTAKSVSWSIGKATGTLTVTPGSLTLTKDAPTATFTIGGNHDGTISVVSSATSIATVSRSGNTVTVNGVSEMSGEATVTVSCSAGANYTAPNDQTVNVVASFGSTVHIYGVQWDGTSTTAMSRTDASSGFTDPVPAVSNGSGSSPFDNLQPWAGMVRVTDSEAGELVAIPKFWYKWTKSGNTLKLQIADGATDGFYVSPAHADRGDGKGERDIVYVGRYHCHTSNYKSQTGGNPKASITRSAARSSIHSLGSTIWQFDLAMRQTIQMLYLVEFADWNSQTKIGYGCGNNRSTANMGYTDAMSYHTGTSQSSRTSYGLGTQYRYIEGLWDNVDDWMDGCYYNSSGLNIILNPTNFSDTENGTLVGKPSNGCPTVMSVADAGGVQWMYPTAANGSNTTYVPDSWGFNSSYPCLYCGGSYYQSLNLGLFCVYYNSTSRTDGSFGCRLQKLP